MKRSINNQLASQFSCVLILHNIICSTLFTLRIIFGPIDQSLAIFETYFSNFWASLSFLILAEISVIKALMVFKWSWIVEVDEKFAGTFLMLFNLGYHLVSQTARFVNIIISQLFCFEMNYINKVYVTDNFSASMHLATYFHK